jgi:hypothetical protein
MFSLAKSVVGREGKFLRTGMCLPLYLPPTMRNGEGLAGSKNEMHQAYAKTGFGP